MDVDLNAEYRADCCVVREWLDAPTASLATSAPSEKTNSTQRLPGT